MLTVPTGMFVIVAQELRTPAAHYLQSPQGTSNSSTLDLGSDSSVHAAYPRAAFPGASAPKMRQALLLRGSDRAPSPLPTSLTLVESSLRSQG